MLVDTLMKSYMHVRSVANHLNEGWRSSVMQHLKLHHSEKRSCVCDVCGKSFKYRSNLNEHLKIHTHLPEHSDTHAV